MQEFETVVKPYSTPVIQAAGSVSQTLLLATGILSSNTPITLPLSIDNVSDVKIQFGVSGGSNVQIRLETITGTALLTQATPATLLFPGTVITPGNYVLVLTPGTVSSNAFYQVIVEATTDLVLVPTLTPATVELVPPPLARCAVNFSYFPIAPPSSEQS